MNKKKVDEYHYRFSMHLMYLYNIINVLTTFRLQQRCFGTFQKMFPQLLKTSVT
jgi:hypothetical protein